MKKKSNKVTIPMVVHTAAEPAAQTKVWIEARTRGEYAAGVTVCNDNVDSAMLDAKRIFGQLVLYIEGVKSGNVEV